MTDFRKSRNYFSLYNILNEEQGGFAITLEVIATLAMMCTFLTTTLYLLRVMNVQRYMNTVMTTTAAEASRWGGGNTRAYRENISSTPLKTTAQQQLYYAARDFNPIITISPDVVRLNSEKITVRIKYSLPPVFSTMSNVSNITGSYDMYNKTRNMNMHVSVNSIMESGKLLN